MKGVSVRGSGHKKEKEEREEKGVEPEKCECAEKEMLPGLKSPRFHRTDFQDEEHESVGLRTAGSSPLPHTPNSHRHAHTLASKGWSTMLDGKQLARSGRSSTDY